MRKFLTVIKPITFLLVHLLALPRRFRAFVFLNTNLYWVSFGYKSAGGIDYFSRDKDFGIKGGWLLFPFYCLIRIIEWVVIVGFYLFILFAPVLWLSSVFDGVINIFIFVGWMYFLGEMEKLIKLDILGEIQWELIYDIEGRAGLDKKLLKNFKKIVWITLLVIWMFGLAPTGLQPLVATAVGGGFVWYYVLPAIRDLWKGFRKDRKK